MDEPTSALEAAQTLTTIRRAELERLWTDADFAAVDPHAGRRPDPPDLIVPDDLISALDTLDHESARVVRVRRIVQQRDGIDPDLPHVLTTSPFRSQSPQGALLAPVQAHRDQRPQRSVVAGPRVPPTRAGAEELVRSAIVAQLAVDELDDWIPSLLAKDATAARREQDAYRAYADAAEAGISASFRPWFDDVLDDLAPDAPVEPFPTVPAYVRGTARTGVLTETEPS